MKERAFFAPLCLCVSVALHGQGVGYVVDNARAQVQVVDLRARRVSASIPAGAESSEMLVLPNNQLAFVSNHGENSVALLDLASNTRLGAVSTGQAPGSLVATADGRYLYVSNEGSNDVTVVDVARRTVAATIPVDATPVQVNLSPNGRFLYVVNQDETPTGTVSVINVNRNQLVKTLPVGLRPSQLAIAPNLTTAYVVNTGSNSLTIVDLTRNEVTGSIAVGQGPASLTFSTNGRFVYVVNRDSNNISVIDTAQQNRRVADIPVGRQPAAMTVTFDSKFGYISNQGSNNVTVLDLTLNAAEDTIAVGTAPFSLMLDPDEDFLYVTNLGSGSVSVIDVNTDRVVATVAVGGVPVQFQLLNAPTLLELTSNPAPAGGRIALHGEGFLAASTVRFTTTAPPRTLTASPAFLDSQGLQVTIPSFTGSSAVVSVANPDGNSSEEVTLRLGSATSAIAPGGVVEGAGFARAPFPISGGSIVSVFGDFSGVVQQGAGSFPLSTTLGNARVIFNGVPAPLIFVSPGQINLVAPVRLLAANTVRVAVGVSGQNSAAETVNVAPAGPGIFVVDADGAGAFLHGTDASLVTSARPARRGETVLMFLSGLGGATPPAIDGEPAPSDVLSPTVGRPVVTVGGAAATVRFSGLAPGFSGLYQINFDVPPTVPAGRDAAVAVSMEGRASNAVRLALE